MEIVFEFEEVPGWIFQKERVVLDSGPGEPDTGLLIEGQLFLLGSFQELLPRIFRQKSQTEMVGINALLLWQTLRRQMRHELMSRESERDGMARLPTQRTAKPVDIETFRGCYIVNRKSEMEKCSRHYFLFNPNGLCLIYDPFGTYVMVPISWSVRIEPS